MQKLTLSVDEGVIRHAKHYAALRGTSVSRLVETMLRMMSSPEAGETAAPPVLSKLRGSLKHGSVADYRRHLERKYR